MRRGATVWLCLLGVVGWAGCQRSDISGPDSLGDGPSPIAVQGESVPPSQITAAPPVQPETVSFTQGEPVAVIDAQETEQASPPVDIAELAKIKGVPSETFLSPPANHVVAPPVFPAEREPLSQRLRR